MFKKSLIFPKKYIIKNLTFPINVEKIRLSLE